MYSFRYADSDNRSFSPSRNLYLISVHPRDLLYFTIHISHLWFKLELVQISYTPHVYTTWHEPGFYYCTTEDHITWDLSIQHTDAISLILTCNDSGFVHHDVYISGFKFALITLCLFTICEKAIWQPCQKVCSTSIVNLLSRKMLRQVQECWWWMFHLKKTTPKKLLIYYIRVL